MQDDLQTDLRVRVSGLLAQQHDIGGLVDDSCNGDDDEQVPVQVDGDQAESQGPPCGKKSVGRPVQVDCVQAESQGPPGDKKSVGRLRKVQKSSSDHSAIRRFFHFGAAKNHMLSR